MTHWLDVVVRALFVAFNDLQKVVVFFPSGRDHNHPQHSAHSIHTFAHDSRPFTIGPCPSVGHSRERIAAENNSICVCSTRLVPVHNNTPIDFAADLA